MDYNKIYQTLIERAQDRTVLGYTEKHHIIPKCMSGGDDISNIVRLTGREHFIAHQLLVKMYPKNGRLIKAAAIMASGSAVMKRSQNRLYEWLRIRLAEEFSKSQTGSGNSQFGTIWIYSLDQQCSKKIDPNDLEKYKLDGWQKGRKLKFTSVKGICEECDTEFIVKTKERFCSDLCRQHTRRQKKSSFFSRKDEFIQIYKQEKHLGKTLKRMGVAVAGAYFNTGKEFIKEFEAK